MTKECKRRPDASITAVDDLEDEDAETVATEDEGQYPAHTEASHDLTRIYADESEETEVVIQTIDDGLDEESEVIASPSTVKRRYEETESDRKHYHKKLRSESPEPTTPDYKQNFLKAVNQAAMEVASATKWKQPVGSLLSAIELTFDAWMAGDLQSLTPRHVATSPFHALAQPAFASPTMLPFVKTPTPSIPSFATTATVTPPSPTLLRRVPMGWMSSSATTLTAPKTPTASTSTSPLPLMGSTPTLVTTPTPPIAFPPIPEMAALEPMASLVTSPNPPMPPMPSTATPPTVPSSLPLDPLHRCLELLVRRCAVCWAHGKRGTDLNHSPWARHCPSSTAATLKIRSFTPLLHKNMSSKVCFGCGISTSVSFIHLLYLTLIASCSSCPMLNATTDYFMVRYGAEIAHSSRRQSRYTMRFL